MDAVRPEVRGINTDNPLDILLVLVDLIRYLTGDPDSLSFTRHICPNLSDDMLVKLTLSSSSRYKHIIGRTISFKCEIHNFDAYAVASQFCHSLCN
jgi:hypothetical protein